MNLDPVIQGFLDEAGDLLSDFEAALLDLEADPGNSETLNRIFRCAHTIKGNSSMLGMDGVAGFTHVLEDLLDKLRKREIGLTAPLMNTLLRSVDALKELLTDAKQGKFIDHAWHEELLKNFRSFADGEKPALSPANQQASPGATASETLYEIYFSPPTGLMQRGLDPLQFLQALSDKGEFLQVTPDVSRIPPLAEMKVENCYLAWTIWHSSKRPKSELEGCFDFIGDAAACTIEALSFEEEKTESKGATAAPSAAKSETRAAKSEALDAGSIRVAIDKVDKLINLVGELVITQSIIAQVVANYSAEKHAILAEAVAQMDRHARDLHERVLTVRMIPIKTLFSRFPRLVRDLAAAVDKQVALEVLGEDTELDKTVIEKIGDPLTHLIRNAIDHGIEPVEDRHAAGKSTSGTVRIEAYQQSGNIHIDIADDGKGLDREKILAKAIQNGLVAPEQTLTDEEIQGLIFRPGFSTAAKVTELSGRGVGMDVVKRNVETLGGSIAIHSEAGKGTRFRIKLPLTLAIMDGQALHVGAQIYILPLVAITESICPARGSVHRLTSGAEVIMIRDKALPLLRLHRIFGVRPKSEDPTQGLVVIVEYEGRQAALFVDELLAQQQVVIKSLETNFSKIDGVAGATILGDGRVALILDVPGLVSLSKSLKTSDEDKSRHNTTWEEATHAMVQ
ncbi:MAG TPA: chemotaxis protein CheA [Candidatus Binatia bacterium]|jgi:two-component system chemotaxis sensor kinase CheA|nr:chemotaxis protein CheA [Candidatus Binatia bacterium]